MRKMPPGGDGWLSSYDRGNCLPVRQARLLACIACLSFSRTVTKNVPKTYAHLKIITVQTQKYTRKNRLSNWDYSTNFQTLFRNDDCSIFFSTVRRANYAGLVV
jgi:hypothetical protein